MVTTAMAAQALNADAERWTDVAEALDDAVRAVGSLGVAPSDFPRDGALHATYAALMEKVTGLMVSGRNQAQEVSDELLYVRRVITGADENAKASIERFWDYTF